ncbi:fatty acid desaturase [Myxococcus xanthus]|uniref:Fatty acid desaturase n=1 Tax=Myxococcus xanthus TaxID=34 RepID=A0AAE6G0Q2_MYXXA|nr:fatty acid desaturase [Myxococcus xanthus]QDE68581.1 fatty acid desaturase [Myxococcus xanthus]QDE75858.1 fatty acid desaturase [Myxococcus xanthus]QDF05050.1 fatty acid desaturase [Myxococcus xanthus]
MDSATRSSAFTSLSRDAERNLIARTRPFAAQDTRRSWWEVGTTFVALLSAIALATLPSWWPLRVVGSVVQALVLIRSFILVHDYLHGSLLSGSRLGKALFHTHAVLLLTPPRVWSETHNHHHANTARLAASASGTFTTWTARQWGEATALERLAYVVERHPLVMIFAYPLAFLGGLCFVPFVKHPLRYWSAGFAVLLHVTISVAVFHFGGLGVYLTAMVLPLSIGYALGAYLFFSQHNFPDVALREDQDWTHASAALEASSYLACGPVMAWFTGNIGYHHVHHLNPRIPFYRLPEAMAAIPELQNPRTTTLHPRDVLACLRLNVWDGERGRMVRFRDVPASR